MRVNVGDPAPRRASRVVARLATPATLVAGRRPPPGSRLALRRLPVDRDRPVDRPPRRGVGSAPPLLPRPCSIRFAPWWVRVLAGRTYPPDFSLDDFAALASRPSGIPGRASSAPLVGPFESRPSRSHDEAESGARSITARHRRVASRVADETGVAVTRRMSPPSSTRRHARIIMNRVNRETARGGKPPTSGVRGDGREESGERHAGRGRRRRRRWTGVSDKQTVPCGSGKKYERAAVPSEGAGRVSRRNESVYGRA